MDVEKLRSVKKWSRGEWLVVSCAEAADEIERLRGELAEADEAGNRLWIKAVKDLSASRDEATALRGALEAARVYVEKWCHYQGDHKALFDQYLGPIDKALASSAGEKAAAVLKAADRVRDWRRKIRQPMQSSTTARKGRECLEAAIDDMCEAVAAYRGKG